MMSKSIAYKTLEGGQMADMVLFKDLVQEITGMVARSEQEVEQALFRASLYCRQSPLDIAIVTKEFLLHVFEGHTYPPARSKGT